MNDDQDDYDPHTQAAIEYAKAPDPKAKFDATANRVFAAGMDMYPGFDEKVEALKQAGVMSAEFVQFITSQSEKPATVINAIGEDLDVAKKLAGQNAVQLAHSIAAIERGEPIPTFDNPRPVYSRSSRALDNPDLPDHLWSKQFDKVYKNGLPGFGGRRGR
jgi:hypothetical protein